MKPKKVLISTASFAEFSLSPLELLEKEGFEIATNPYGRRLKAEESIYLLQNAVGLIAGTELLSGDVLRSAKSLKIISRCGAGVDNIDMDTAKELGILVLNTPEAPVRAVAELTLGLIFSITRRITGSDRKIRSGGWEKKNGILLQGKTVGIVGLGKVGKEVVRLLKPFGIELFAYDILPDHSFAVSNDVKMVTLEELLKDSDIVSIHVSGGKENHGLIGEEALSFMKNGSYLINTSRGGVVDEEALARHLEDNIIAGAALDVFELEPYEGKLADLDNTVLTCHIGSYARETRIKMEREAVENFLSNFKKLDEV